MDLLIILLALKSTGITKCFVSFLGDLCEIFSWENYGFDAHEIDTHPLDSLNDVDLISEIKKAKVNPVSKSFLKHLFQFAKMGVIKVQGESRGLAVSLGKKVEEQKQFYLNFPGYLKLYRQIRTFIYKNIHSQPHFQYAIESLMDMANSMSKKCIMEGETVYFVHKKSVVLNSIKQILSQLIGLGALINNDAVESLIDKIRDKVTKKYNPYFNENYQRFLERACRDRLHPIRVCGRCTDVREERNKIVLCLQGDGAVRIYTYKDCYKIMDWYDLDENIITVDGLPYQNHGIPVVVALKIIRRNLLR